MRSRLDWFNIGAGPVIVERIRIAEPGLDPFAPRTDDPSFIMRPQVTTVEITMSSMDIPPGASRASHMNQIRAFTEARDSHSMLSMTVGVTGESALAALTNLAVHDVDTDRTYEDGIDGLTTTIHCVTEDQVQRLVRGNAPRVAEVPMA